MNALSFFSHRDLRCSNKYRSASSINSTIWSILNPSHTNVDVYRYIKSDSKIRDESEIKISFVSDFPSRIFDLKASEDQKGSKNYRNILLNASDRPARTPLFA